VGIFSATSALPSVLLICSNVLQFILNAHHAEKMGSPDRLQPIRHTLGEQWGVLVAVAHKFRRLDGNREDMRTSDDEKESGLRDGFIGCEDRDISDASRY